MKDRIRLIMEDQHLTQKSFSQLTGIGEASLSSIFNDRTKPTLNHIDAIHKKFPQVRLEWLLYGTPPMYIENENQMMLPLLHLQVRQILLLPSVDWLLTLVTMHLSLPLKLLLVLHQPMSLQQPLHRCIKARFLISLICPV